MQHHGFAAGRVRPHLQWCLLLAALTVLASGSPTHAELLAPNQLGLRIQRGFTVTLFADATLADDIQALAIDPRGQVVVTGPGYVRTLIDDDGDGRADRAVDYARSTTGGMGMVFDGTDLLFVGDGGLWRFSDADRDGQVDGPPNRLLSLKSGEHGGHAVRKGPDGAIYVMAGNDAEPPGLSAPTGPAKTMSMEGGALLRLPPGGEGGFQVFAHGFRNAYDFDFNADGDLFTWDSDAEADFLLPWYTPTRLYHVVPGGHHGWRLGGWKRSWNRPEYSPDTVSILEDLGRGSPAGMACYRHLQFPPAYRNGLFALDWTFGRVCFLPLTATGSTYDTEAEVFLESSGTTGFAPTDVAVGWDGALMISTGGRKSHGGVYRVDYVGEPALAVLATNWAQLAPTELNAVLTAPQPLDQWSRELWVPIAERLGPEPFSLVARESREEPERRVRAIEILTVVHAGLSTAEAEICAQAQSPLVRARTAWALGVRPSANAAVVLTGLTRDSSPYVRCAALDALRERVSGWTPAILQQALSLNLAHPDKRVRQAAALLATWLSDAAWNALFAQRNTLPPQSRLTLTMALLWRTAPTTVNSAGIDTALAVLAQTRDPDLQLQAVRLIITALGDYNLKAPSAEVFTGYEPAIAPIDTALASRIEKAVAPLFPARAPNLNIEVTALLAMIEARATSLPLRLVSAIGPRTPADQDFHYLATLARLGGTLPTNVLSQAVAAIVALERKWDGAVTRPKQNWSLRLNEVVQRLSQHNPAMFDALVKHPDFPRPGNLPLVTVLDPERKTAAARLFYNAVQRTPSFPWSPELIDLLSKLPKELTFPLFRRQWVNPGLRDRLLVPLATHPLVEDREKYFLGLSSADPAVSRVSAGALLQLPPDPSTGAMSHALRWLRRLLTTPSEPSARAQALGLINHLSGQKLTVRERGQNLVADYQPLFDFIASRYSGALTGIDAASEGNPAQWAQFYRSVPWNRGDPRNGETVFQQRGCLNCHLGSSAVGPDLAGAVRRLSPTELFDAILFPSREVASAYLATIVRLRNGQVHTGMVIFEAGDMVLLQTGQSSTARLRPEDIASREQSQLSFMPTGLLSNLGPQEFADLYAYLKSLSAGP